jgi:hypothetical protein
MDDRENRNAVFSSGQPNVDPRIPSISTADKLKQEFGLDIPVELVPLPSLGKVYPEGSSFHNRDSVEITAMTAREEDILTSRALIKKGTVISELLRSCLVDKRVNVADLLVGDRNALMIAIRITGYGADYDVEIECPSCSTKSKQTFNLAELPVRPLQIEPVSPGLNLFEFMLPMSKKRVQFKFLTGRDEEEISNTKTKTQKAGFLNDNTVTTNLMYSIQSIDGVTDRSKISQFVKAMPARDSLALRKYINDNQPDVITKQELMCPNCDHLEEATMPIGASFFWPDSRS